MEELRPAAVRDAGRPGDDEVLEQAGVIRTGRLDGQRNPGIARDIPELALVRDAADNDLAILEPDPGHAQVRGTIVVEGSDGGDRIGLEQLDGGLAEDMRHPSRITPSIDAQRRKWHAAAMSDTAIVSVGPKGRVVIPVEIRRELGIREGSELVALVEGEAVVLVPRSAIKARLRSIFAGLDTSMRDELIAERRADASRDA